MKTELHLLLLHKCLTKEALQNHHMHMSIGVDVSWAYFQENIIP